MPEEFIQFIWQHQLFQSNKLATTDHKPIEIILPGTLNTNAGPDFENARIKIENTIWVGNVEIHTESSNWKKHGHQNDKSYNNVILHVVATHNSNTLSSDGKHIPTLIIKPDHKLFQNYISLRESKHTIGCSDNIASVDSFTWLNWFDRLAIERLEEKTNEIKEILTLTRNNWEESFYLMLAKSFGFKTNKVPFELLARATPLKVISKYHNNLKQLEAILFGQAGFLTEPEGDDYYRQLRKEYLYLQKTLKLKPIDTHLWKFMRLRPANFPTVRIAQFAAIIHKSKRLFSRVIEAEDIETLTNFIHAHPSDYWDSHYSFKKGSKGHTKTIGKQSIHTILINTLIPFIFLYGKERAKPTYCDKAIRFLEILPSESNLITRLWSELSIKSSNAFESQALIQLFNSYCNEKNCLYCQVGNSILTKQLEL